jgi:hypothetical protein
VGEAGGGGVRVGIRDKVGDGGSQIRVGVRARVGVGVRV